MADLGQAKTRTPQWVLDHLPKRQLEKMYDHLQQINLIAKSSGMWDFQRTGFFKQSEAFQKKVRKAADKDMYGKRVEKSLKARQKRRK
jgi:hypothetical protein